MVAEGPLADYVRTVITRMREEAENLTDPAVQEAVQRILDEFADAVAHITGPPPKPRASFTCPLCKRVSYNLNDISARYCGACHRFWSYNASWKT